MNTIIRSALCALALLAPGWFSVRAAEPAPAGRFAVLDNGRLLEGEIERVGEQYRVRRTIGETWVPADKVQCVCATLEAAYQFLRGQANLRDADERLRLARWCQQHGLKAQALAEVTAGLELRPNHAESRRLCQSLRRAETPCPAPARPPEESDPEPALPPPDFNSEALGPFVTRVQPILMNTCARCHAAGHDGAFKLIRTYENALTNRRATQHNLAAVLALVNRDRPQQSPLLARALSPHGNADQPPLKGRQTPAYRQLEEWVQMALVNTARHEPAPTAAVVPAAGPRLFADVAAPPAAAAPSPAAEPSPPAAAPADAPASATTSPPEAAPPAPQETPSTGKEDPFDPAVFNRQMHPEKK